MCGEEHQRRTGEDAADAERGRLDSGEELQGCVDRRALARRGAGSGTNGGSWPG